MKPIGLQLYSVREAAAQDFIGTIRKVAEMGYKGVEYAGLHGHDPREIKKLTDDLGLVVTSSHLPLVTRENAAQIAETELALGNKRPISAGISSDSYTTLDACKETAEKFQTAIDLLKPYGLSYGIHNHDQEFQQVGGRYSYDIVLEMVPELFSELDIYWTSYAGVDTKAILKEHASRIPLLHVKDGMLKDRSPMTAIGSGLVDIPGIIGAADPDKMEWLIVEIDECDSDMLEAVRQSYDYLTSNGLAVGSK